MNGRGIVKGGLVNWVSRLGERLVMDRVFDRAYLVMGGHIFFQTLSAAVQLDLFTLLARRRRMTCHDIAEAIKVADKPIRILLLGCTALKLLRKHADGTYSNSFMSSRLLNADNPRNVLAVVKWQHFINYRAMYHFHDAIRANANVGLAEISGTGATLYEHLSAHPDLERIFQDAMQSISVQANDLLARSVDFTQFRNLLDVGGGNGTNIMNLARHNPHLKAGVFDWPSVCAIAERHIVENGLADRLRAVRGNCFVDPFPRDVDCILFAHFLTIWSEEKNRILLKKAYEALPPGGAAIVFNMMQRDDETGPLSAAWGSPYFLTLATGEGMLYTWSEYRTWMQEAGFKTVLTTALVRDHGLVIGIKG